MVAVAEASHNVDAHLEGFALLVGPIGGGKGFKDVGDGHDPRGHGELGRREPARITLAIEGLVVGAGVFRHPRKIAGEGQVFQHLNRLHDVIVDLVALLGGESAP